MKIGDFFQLLHFHFFVFKAIFDLSKNRLLNTVYNWIRLLPFSIIFPFRFWSHEFDFLLLSDCLSLAQLGLAWASGPLGYCFDLGSILTISLKNRLSVQSLFEFLFMYLIFWTYFNNLLIPHYNFARVVKFAKKSMPLNIFYKS